MHRAPRALVYPVVAAVGAALAVTVAVAPAFANAGTITPTTWAYVDSAAPNSTFMKSAGDALLGTRTGDDQQAHTYRSYFTYDLTALRGQVLRDARFWSYEQDVDDCDTAVTIELWRTGPLRPNLTWRHQPAEQELVHQFLRGRPAEASCPSYLGWNLQPLVVAALDRHETKLTLELRITAGAETAAGNARTLQWPSMGLAANFPPTVGKLGLRGQEHTCGTLERHPTVGVWPYLQATVADRDGTDVTTRFAVWPVDHPDQRREVWGGSGVGVVSNGADLASFADGTVLAWSAQAKDYYDASAWAAPCYLTLDRTPPATAPVVVSKAYPAGDVASGGPGVPGRFRFDARGDREVVGFRYGDGNGVIKEVAARHPGGSAIIEYTPDRWGRLRLEVAGYDVAGNVGPTTTYEFWVRNTVPTASIDVAGVGLPSTIRLSSSIPEVTEFGYQIAGQPEARVAVSGGTATGQITFPAAGSIEVTLRSYAGSRMIGTGTMWANVTDEPVVESAEFTWEHDVVAGTPGTFTFRPRTTGVVAYEADFNDGSAVQRVPAAADGTATLRWTPTVGTWYYLTVVSVQADGTRSQPAQYQFNVIDPHPQVSAPELSSWPRGDGVGVPTRIEFSSGLPNLAGFAFRFNGGPEQTLTSPDWYQSTTVVPDHAGDNTIVVVALLADGTRSPETTYTFSISNGPVVTMTSEGAATVGRTATFRITPGLPDVRRYQIDFGGYGTTVQTVEADPDGTATVFYTPSTSSLIDMQVVSIGSDGTRSDTRHQYVIARDNKVHVSASGFSEYSPAGGIGVGAGFSFSSELSGEVVDFLYHLDDDPEQTVPASTTGASAHVMVTLTRNGQNTLYVRSRTTSGELSPVTAYQFRVGTAPHVVSAQYPNGQWAGGPGATGTFEFSGGTAGITAFEYQFDGAATTTVPADESGRASMTYTPTVAYESRTLTVTGRLADGTATDTTRYFIYVKNGS